MIKKVDDTLHGTFKTFDEIPKYWNKLSEHNLIYDHGVWLELMKGRISGKPVFFSLEGQENKIIATHGIVIGDPNIYDPFNLYSLLATPKPEFSIKQQTMSETDLSRLPRKEEWFPVLAIMVPGFHCSFAGHVQSESFLHQFFYSIEQWCRQRGIKAITFLYLSSDQEMLIKQLHKEGYARFPITYRSVLDLEGNSLEEFMEQFPSKRRNSIKREMRTLQDENVKVKVKRIEECEEEILRLRMKLVNKYGGYSSFESENKRLQCLKQAFLHEEIIVITADYEDKIIGFGLFLLYRERLYAFWTGTDHEHSKSKFLYFNLLFYYMVPFAQVRGIRSIDYGVGHWQGKAARGCKLIAHDGWAKGLNDPFTDVIYHICASQ